MKTTIPKFKSEKEERAFWASHDSREYLDWKKGKKVVFPNLGKGMRAQYDFSKMKSVKNPYSSRLKRPVTIRLDRGTISHFKALATEMGMPYQNLIALYLRDCAVHHKKLAWKWD